MSIKFNRNIASSPSSWIVPALLNSWTVFAGTSVNYMKDALGFVHVRGIVAGGTITNGTVILNLPSGFRPAFAVGFSTASNNGSAWGSAKLTIGPAGNILIDVVTGNAQLILDGISFLGEQ